MKDKIISDLKSAETEIDELLQEAKSEDIQKLQKVGIVLRDTRMELEVKSSNNYIHNYIREGLKERLKDEVD